MIFSAGQLKLLLLFVICGTGIFTLTILNEKPFDRVRARHLRHEQSHLSYKTNTAPLASPTTAPEKGESTFLKLPQNLNLSCWINPCEDKNVSDATWEMVFVVKSAIDHGIARQIIRRTWASLSYVEGFKFTTVFVVGMTTPQKQALIEEEFERYGDLLQLNISDQYRFIAQKTLGGMKWAFEYLPDDVFYTSCDDDFMINMAGLVDTLKWHQDMVNTSNWSNFPIICTYKARYSDGPDRRNTSKYYISKDEYKWPYYPDYCLGGAYTTSVGVARQLWEAAQKAKRLKMDDVWITGILRERIGMPRQYVRKLENSVATHHFGFRTEKDKTNREKMREEWKAEQIKMQNLTTCICSVL